MYEMDITWGRTFKVWWAFTWRNLIAALCAMLVSIVLGILIGVVMHIMGMPLHLVRVVCTVIGAILGLLVSTIPMKLILGKNFGEFRLVLVPHEALLDKST